MTTNPANITMDQTGRTVLRRWRSVQGFGGLFLAFSFFMPMISYCNSTVVPALDFIDDAAGFTEDPGNMVWSFLTMLSPYLFGAISMFIGFRGRRIGAFDQDRSGVPVAVLFGTALTIVGIIGISLIIGFVTYPQSSTSVWEVLFLGFIAFSVYYFFLSIRRGAGGLLSLRWYAGICCLTWFGFWIAGDEKHGLWVSLFGTWLIVVGVVKEASWVGGEGDLRTLRRLLNCEVRFHDIAGPRCGTCGYLLIGLSSGRCPECGTAVAPNRQNSPMAAGTVGAPVS